MARTSGPGVGRRGDPAGRLRLWRLPSRRCAGPVQPDHGRRPRARRARRSRARHLQRVPGAGRGGDGTGRARAQRIPPLRAPLGAPGGGAAGYPLHVRRAPGTDTAPSRRSWGGLLHAAGAGPGCPGGARWGPLPLPVPGGQPERVGAGHRGRPRRARQRLRADAPSRARFRGPAGLGRRPVAAALAGDQRR